MAGIPPDGRRVDARRRGVVGDWGTGRLEWTAAPHAPTRESSLRESRVRDSELPVATHRGEGKGERGVLGQGQVSMG